MAEKNFKRWVRDEIYRQVPVSVSVIDRDYLIVEANELMTRTFGDWNGRHCYEVYKGSDSPCPDCQAAKTFEDGRVRVSQEIGTDRDGQPIRYMVHLAPLVEEDGSIPYIIEMSTDITEVGFLQDQLREKQERYRLLFEEVPCYISIQDRDFRLLETNRLFKEHFGEPEGKCCYEAYKHRTEQCYPCPVAETFSDGKVRRSEEVVTSRDGRKVNVVCYTAPIFDSDGKIMAVMEMSTDITQIRQLQSQLTSIGLLVSSISHGAKSLLMGLDGGIYAVDSGFERNDEVRVKKGWDMVKRNVNKIRSMVLNILYYSKGRELEWETRDAAEIAGEAAEVVESKARECGVEFKRDFDSAAGRLEADAKAIRTVLVNILENAIDACRVDGRKTEHRISLAVSGEPDEVVFAVCDNGIGMDRETREKLFTLFFSSKGVGGTGLGLFVSSKIIQKHGGSISVDSTPGEGSCFTVRLPRKKTVVEKPEPAEPAPDEIAGIL
ncbi:MAG: PAS domain-containing sensor histidine kinase [bacterium]